MAQTLFDIPLKNTTRKNIREKIQKQISHPSSFFHIVSLNPEIIVLSKENTSFKSALQSASIHIFDGIGLVLAAYMCGISWPMHITGVDLMTDIIKECEGKGLHIMFLGGGDGLAEKTAACYKKKYKNTEYYGIQGIKDIRANDIHKEEECVFDEIKKFRPHIIFAAFGSPYQELWFWKHRDRLRGIVCMGVGGAFDFVTGTIPRAPLWVRSLGLEWLYRLIKQPWRWKRQLRLIRFLFLGVKEVFFYTALTLKCE